MSAQPTFEDGDYSVLRRTSLLLKDTLFDGVVTRYTARQQCVQNDADYTPAAIGTAHPDDATYLLMREDTFNDLGEGKVEWTQHYLQLPARRIEGRAIAYTLPGLAAGGVNPFVPITTVTTSSTLVTVETTTDHGLATGDIIVIYYGQVISKYVTQFHTLQTATVTGPTTFTMPVFAVPPIGATNGVYVQKVSPTGTPTKRGRAPISKTVRGYVVYDYYVSADGSVDGDTGNQIPILVPPLIIDINKQVTDTYDVNTDPSLVDYLAAIDAANDAGNGTFDTLLDAGALIVSTPSAVRRLQGNIWERETEYVLAQ